MNNVYRNLYSRQLASLPTPPPLLPLQLRLYKSPLEIITTTLELNARAHVDAANVLLLAQRLSLGDALSTSSFVLVDGSFLAK